MRIRARLDLLEKLTPREREALVLRMGHESNKATAKRMGIQVATVKKELHSAYRKLGVRNAEEAARFVRLGITRQKTP